MGKNHVQTKLAVHKGEELTISYEPPMEDEDLKARRKSLEATWGFECMCERCVKEDELDEKDANDAVAESTFDCDVWKALLMPEWFE